jgi:hypothetical protein
MRPIVTGSAVTFLLAGPCSAQDGWRWFLPDTRHFSALIADPLEPRFTLGVLQTDILTRQGPERLPFTLADPEDSRSDVVAAVGIGLNIPFISLISMEDGGINLTGHAGVFSRFRIENRSRDDMGQDWVVGGGLEMRKADVSGRLRVHHRSSHLGDEFSAATGATRIEFGGEAAEVLAAYAPRESVRVYGGGSWIFHSNTANTAVMRQLGRRDRYTVQLGADGEWYKWANGHVGVHAGADWQAAQRTSWRGAGSVLAGVGMRRNRELRLSLRYFTGPSTMGEFFLTPERLLHVELSGRFF